MDASGQPTRHAEADQPAALQAHLQTVRALRLAPGTVVRSVVLEGWTVTQATVDEWSSAVPEWAQGKVEWRSGRETSLWGETRLQYYQRTLSQE